MFKPNMNVIIEKIGAEQQPLVIADHFSSVADKLAEVAQQRPFHNEKTFYPGHRSIAPNQYLQTIQTFAQTTLAEAFQFKNEELVSIDSAFSIVTRTPDQLKPYQRIPHFDIPKMAGIACIHYLFSEDTGFGGTSFYRHNRTGYEYVDEPRADQYMQLINQELESNGLPEPPQYINGSTDLFTRVLSCEAKFNRILFYRACMLHSGDIHIDHPFHAGPADNRLTMTSFIKLKSTV